MVAYHDIVSHMAVGHDQAVAANDSLALRSSATVDGGKFTNRCVVADDGYCLLTLEFQVLWDVAHNGARVDVTILADASTRADDCIAVDDGAVANLHIGVDGDKRSYFDSIANLGVGMNRCQRLQLLIIHSFLNWILRIVHDASCTVH